jgi:hypothetical protein
MAYRKLRRPYKRAGKLARETKYRENAIKQARLVPSAPDGLAYKVTVETDHDHLELFTDQPYTALMASEAMADRMQARTHVMLGSIPVASQRPMRRRRVPK